MITVEVFHADSLAGPMRKLKQAFEASVANIMINLTSGRSKELAERIAGGAVCDVFAPSDPAVVSSAGAAWSVIFSANEMVLITQKGNPLRIHQVSSLAKPGVRLARVAGEKDMATFRTIEFIKKTTESEGASSLAEGIIDSAHIKAPSIPDALEAVTSKAADAAVVYLSAAVSVAASVEIIFFAPSLNLSGEIRNALTIPATAANPAEAASFIKFILSADGHDILRNSGQPPIVPPIKSGEVPAFLIA